MANPPTETKDYFYYPFKEKKKPNISDRAWLSQQTIKRFLLIIEGPKEKPKNHWLIGNAKAFWKWIVMMATQHYKCTMATELYIGKWLTW